MTFKKHFFATYFVVLLLIASQAFQLSGQSNVDLYKDFQLIREQGFSNSNLRELAIELTDGIGPRLSGSLGFEKSVNWAKQKLESMGIENARVEEAGTFGNGWEIEKFYFAQSQPYYQPLIGVVEAWTGSTSGLTKAEVILVSAKNKEELDKYKGLLNGKIVITPYTEEPELSFEPYASRFTDDELQKQNETSDFKADVDQFIRERRGNTRLNPSTGLNIDEFALREGAVAILKNSGNYGIIRGGGARNGRNLPSLGIPVVNMTFEHYGRIVRLLDRKIVVELELEVSSKITSNSTKVYNVLGEIKGSHKKLKDEVVMIGAHIDSWHGGTGAVDNGSGVILMMEVMRILKQSGVKLDRTIRIALWGGEEQGLLGSRNWVTNNLYNAETSTKGPEYDRISAYYNFDYGTGKVKGIYLQDNFALKPIFEQFIEPLKDIGVNAISTRNPGGSDHMAFNRLGIPGFALIQDKLEYSRTYHTNFDTFERIHLGDLKQAAVVVATLVYQTANHPEKLPRKVIQ